MKFWKIVRDSSEFISVSNLTYIRISKRKLLSIYISITKFCIKMFFAKDEVGSTEQSMRVISFSLQLNLQNEYFVVKMHKGLHAKFSNFKVHQIGKWKKLKLIAAIFLMFSYTKTIGNLNFSQSNKNKIKTSSSLGRSNHLDVWIFILTEKYFKFAFRSWNVCQKKSFTDKIQS